MPESVTYVSGIPCNPCPRKGSLGLFRSASIVGLCAVTVVLAALSFVNLVVTMAVLYSASLVLEFVALITFRLRRPAAPRAVRVPGGPWGLAYVCPPPLGVSVAIFATTLRQGAWDVQQLLIVAGVALSGVAVYARVRSRESSRLSHSAFRANKPSAH